MRAMAGRSWLVSAFFGVIAGDVVAYRLWHGLAGDLAPGLFQGWHAELAREAG